MRHLITRKTDEGVEVIYHRDTDENPYLTFSFTRVVQGLAFADNFYYTVVVGERTFFSEGRGGLARYYVVLDEAQAPDPGAFGKRLVQLKDQYGTFLVVLPDSPRRLVESLQGLEGLTYYGETVPSLIKPRWPSYVSADWVATLIPEKVPDASSAIHRDLESFVSEACRDPSTGVAYAQSDGTPIRRLLVPRTLNTRLIDTAIRQGKDDLCSALWLATTYLESSKPRKATRKPPKDERRTSATGY